MDHHHTDERRPTAPFLLGFDLTSASQAGINVGPGRVASLVWGSVFRVPFRLVPFTKSQVDLAGGRNDSHTLHGTCHICRSVGVVDWGSIERQSYASRTVPLVVSGYGDVEAKNSIIFSSVLGCWASQLLDLVARCLARGDSACAQGYALLMTALVWNPGKDLERKEQHSKESA